ncbi:hypothetical protein [Candidatus Liberibacter americanus]|uniref:Uncharacterized protein n=1 Tax=Candidatus Liberibacter americanus str. Sao Paulo TaxID=1261131 RepID=U6B823_9HYPH|nr:hypothetical protein [Candidatus Liberibacter americanus]AHA28011.1 hypothetical protein lam_665 [Candidatus Liberibacter americanus str. Sao Paulo]EMS35792.1 hypothetical protein G653_04806 [Candidatus Liberibacter americanus PW_SP]
MDETTISIKESISSLRYYILNQDVNYLYNAYNCLSQCTIQLPNILKAQDDICKITRDLADMNIEDFEACEKAKKLAQDLEYFISHVERETVCVAHDVCV